MLSAASWTQSRRSSASPSSIAPASGSCDGTRRELALEALHLLVLGKAGPRLGPDRLGRTVIRIMAMEAREIKTGKRSD
jgi:hypothetical protein